MLRKCDLSSYFFSCCYVPNDITEAKYCETHGCSSCNYANPKSSFSKSKKKIEANLGEKKEEVCSIACKDKIEKENFQKRFGEEQETKKELAEKIAEFDNNTITEIKNIFSPFYEKVIKEVRINELKGKFLRAEINLFQFHAMCIASIDENSL